MNIGPTAEPPRFVGGHGPWRIDSAWCRDDDWVESSRMREGPMARLPADLWRVVVMHLQASETMSLRCTAHLMQRNLFVVTQAIVAGCQMIAQLTQPKNLRSISPSKDIDQFMALRLEARCHLIYRYAKQIGLASFHKRGYIYTEKAQSLQALKAAYFTKRFPAPDSDGERSLTAWRDGIEATQAELRVAMYDVSDSIALGELYAAEMYAPLLGVIADPVAHTDDILAAAGRMSMTRWMDFLYASGPIRDACPSVAIAYEALTASIDRSYPMPRIDVLAAMLHASLTSVNPQPIRKMCVERIGVTSAFLAETIAPRVAQIIAESVLADADRNWTDVPLSLMGIAQRWDDIDGSFFTCLHQAFLTVFAKKMNRTSLPWEKLSSRERRVLCTRVLHIPPNESRRYGFEGPTVLTFWGLYFEISNPHAVALPLALWRRIEALPWPLQGPLWLLAAEKTEDLLPLLTATGGASWGDRSVAPPQTSVEMVLMQAMAAWSPELAVSAVQATLTWQLTWAAAVGARSTRRLSMPSAGRGLDRPRHLVFSSQAWRVLNACTVEQRLPFVAALFNYRDSAAGLGYEWTFETFISADIIAFLCNPTSRLICPSRAVMDVLLHYLPLCWARLPERLLRSPAAQADDLARRMGLPLDEIFRALSSLPGFRANLHRARP